MNSLCIVMVTYNPKERTYESIDKLLSFNQVKTVIVVDNTPDRNCFFNRYKSNSRIRIIKNQKNLGIAKAQNIGLQYLMENGEKWAITLDQDTVIYESLLEKYIYYIRTNDCRDIGIVATDYIDIGTGTNKFNNFFSKTVDETISSGSLIQLSVFNRIGKMKNQYFIDQVDNEYCYRLIKNGYKIVVLPGIGMEHKLGNIKKRNFLFKHIYVYNQAPIRVYYRTRNIIWFLREYKDAKLFKEKTYALLCDLVRIFYEKDKIVKYKMFIKGAFDGITKSYS